MPLHGRRHFGWRRNDGDDWISHKHRNVAAECQSVDAAPTAPKGTVPSACLYTCPWHRPGSRPLCRRRVYTHVYGTGQSQGECAVGQRCHRIPARCHTGSCCHSRPACSRHTDTATAYSWHAGTGTAVPSLPWHPVLAAARTL